MSPAVAPRFSTIVPAFNEERYLPPLLDSIEAARSAYRGGPAAIEVVVADNASTDRTADIAAERGCRLVRVDQRCIAAARNGGARAARGEVLTFVDADMRIHPGTYDAIDAAISRSDVVGGASGVTLDRWSTGLAATYVAMLPIVWLTRMDTGVVFCRRTDFEATGGYDERRRIAEDVAFLLALRRVGRARHAGLARLKNVKAVASTRKFDAHGDWHYFTKMLALTCLLLLRRRAADEIIDRYWYAPGR